LKKFGLATICTIVVVLFFLFPFATKIANAATNGKVNVPVLNVRSGPGTGYAKISAVTEGQTYPVITSQNGWYRLQIGSAPGWVSGDYLAVTSTPTVPSGNQVQELPPLGTIKVTADLLNVRQGADLSSSKISIIKMGEAYQYFDKSGEWYNVKVGSTYGWVNGNYVATVSTEIADPPRKPEQPTQPQNPQTPGGSGSTGGTTVIDSVTANVDQLNVRREKDQNAPVIGTAIKGSAYKVIERYRGWFKVQYGSQIGWIADNNVTINYKTIYEEKPVQSTVNVIESLKFYKTSMKNCVAIPVTLKVSKDSNITALNPEFINNKAQDGRIEITVNNSIFNGESRNITVSDNELYSVVYITSTSDNKSVVTIVPKMGIDYDVYNVPGKNYEDNEYRYLYTYVVVSFKKPVNTVSIQSTPQISTGGKQRNTVISTPVSGKGRYLIALDAGHGGTTPGAVSGGCEEKVLNLDVIMKLNNILKAQGYDTYLTRDKDEYVSLSERADSANVLKANIFISVHNNSFTSSAKGTETLYNSQAKEQGKRLAATIQTHLVEELNRNNRGVIDRPDLAVLNSTYMPAALTEIMFMSNQEELGLIKQESVRQKTAEAIAKAVNEYFGLN